PSRVVPVAQLNRSAVVLRNLPAQNQADSRPASLRSEEGDEQIRGGRKSGTLVQHLYDERVTIGEPAQLNSAFRFQGGVYRVANQVDQQLIELVAICANGNVFAFHEPDR